MYVYIYKYMNIDNYIYYIDTDTIGINLEKYTQSWQVISHCQPLDLPVS